MLRASQASRAYVCAQCRHFSVLPVLRSGHNRWSKIRHDKGAKDASKNKQRSQFAQEIAAASRRRRSARLSLLTGHANEPPVFGPDPSSNTRLATAIAAAKKNHFPKASIEHAIARGQGLSTTGAPLESVTVEAMFPPGVGVVLDCLTESKGQTIQETRALIKEFGGAASPSAYLFEKKGRVVFKEKEGFGVDEVLDAAIEAGAEDIREEDGNVVALCGTTETKNVAEGMEKETGLEVESLGIVWDAVEDTRIEVQDEALVTQLDSFVDKIMEAPGVQSVSMNANGDAVWERLSDRVYLGKDS
jgi:transcriptional/translational regulatory protein YebC/TACO1